MKLQSRLTKVKNNIVFESHPDFTDNTKVLFDEMMSMSFNEDYQFIWVVDNIDAVAEIASNYTNIQLVPLKGVGFLGKIKAEYVRNKTLASCKYYFFSNRQVTRVAPKKNQRFVYLTHGIGLKYWRDRGFSSNLFSDIVVSSEYAAELISKNFDQVDEKKMIAGNPRNTHLLNRTVNKRKAILETFNAKTDQSIIVWMPTYRRHVDGSSNDSGHSDTESDLPIIKNDRDWIYINDILVEENALLVFKPHPQQDLSKIYVDALSNVRIVDDSFLKNNQLTTYEILAVSDSLMTDYSSVYFDFMLVDKPLGFTIDDFEEYKKNVGFVVNEPMEIMPGYKILNMDDLEKFLRTYKNDEWKTERHALCTKIHNTPSLDYSMNILRALKIVETL